MHKVGLVDHEAKDGLRLRLVAVVHMYLMMKIPFNVYCPVCLPGGTIVHPGGQQKKKVLVLYRLYM